MAPSSAVSAGSAVNKPAAHQPVRPSVEKNRIQAEDWLEERQVLQALQAMETPGEQELRVRNPWEMEAT